MFDWMTSPEAWIALATLTALEIVLGIDNIIFISILSNRLPEAQQNRARILGLAVALIGRIGLLLSLTFIMRLTEPIITIMDHPVSGRDIILILGGLFLLAKATREIHHNVEGPLEEKKVASHPSFNSVLLQIFVLDMVFSLDSVITAVGMVDLVPVMVTAIVIAILFMMVSANAVSSFIETHPTVKILALSFLMMVGIALIAEGFEIHIPRGYIYFAMAFSVFVEMINIRSGSRKKSLV
ncbi:MAG: TerC family protein [Bacteroidetes bacterium]|nr:MAG: TerC family protein [Bacteroidota bacterium]